MTLFLRPWQKLENRDALILSSFFAETQSPLLENTAAGRGMASICSPQSSHGHPWPACVAMYGSPVVNCPPRRAWQHGTPTSAYKRKLKRVGPLGKAGKLRGYHNHQRSIAKIWPLTNT